MKKMVIIAKLSVLTLTQLHAQKLDWENSVRVVEKFFNDYGIRFEEDTFHDVEGTIYHFSSLIDSSYFRLNLIDGMVRFGNWGDRKVYIELKRNYENGILDTSGKIANTTNLFWRSLTFSEMEIIYDHCTLENLKLYNQIMDSIYDNLLHSNK